MGMINAQFCKTPFVNKPINKIERFEFEDWWKKDLSKKCGLSSTTIRAYLTTLSGIFDYAVGRYIDSNPVKNVKRPKGKEGKIYPLDKYEVKILLDKAQEQEQDFKKHMESIFDYLVVKIWTGLRISEINALETRKRTRRLERLRLIDMGTGYDATTLRPLLT